MALRHRIAYLRKEHGELLRLAERIEAALRLASRPDFPEHLQCITELRALEHGFGGIVEHCHAENRILESTYHHYLDAEERGRTDAEHQDIVKGLAEFREELRFATADRTKPLIAPGTEVVNKLRTHVGLDEQLLDRIEKGGTAANRGTPKYEVRKTGLSKPRRRAAKRSKTVDKEIHSVPYTVERHWEL